MTITVGERVIETDPEGYLINPDDWDEDVAEAMALEQCECDHVTLTDDHWGLIQYFRDYYESQKTHPSMHELVMNLGKQHGRHFHERKAYEEYLYTLFPHGPVPGLCKLAGLQKPTNEFEG